MRRANPEQMAKWLARGAQYGWSLSELARRSGYPAWKLGWWQKRRDRFRAAETASGAFVAVELTDAVSSPPATLEVTTPSGHRVSVPAGFDAEHLRRLLAAIATAC
jgi:hypothetical protein